LKNILFLLPLLFSADALLSQTYNTYYQGGNNNSGGAYVAPLITRTYTFKSNTFTPAPAYTPATVNNYSSGASYSSGSSSSGETILYRSRWSRRADRLYAAHQEKIQQQNIKAQEWANQTKTVMRHFAAGKLEEAEKIRRSVWGIAPIGAAPIIKAANIDLLGPGMFSEYAYEFKYVKMYNYTCLLLLLELKAYKEAEQHYRDYFTDGNTFNHQEQTERLVKIFNTFTYPEIFQLESAYIEALEHVKGRAVAQKHWMAVSNFYVPYIDAKITDLTQKSRCYNTLAMVQFQLGLGNDAVKYFKKQFKVNPDDYLARFTVLQNIVEYTLNSKVNDTTVTRFCLDEFNNLLNSSAALKNPELTFSINYNKACLLLAVGRPEEAEAAINSQVHVEAHNNFPLLILKANILMKALAKPLPDSELEIKERELDNYTAAQRREFDSLLGAGAFDNGQAARTLRFKRTDEQFAIMQQITDLYPSLTKEQLLEAKIYSAEYYVQNFIDYEMAKSGYEMIIMSESIKWPYQLRIAEINVLGKKYSEAVDLLKKTIAENPEEYSLYLVLADIYRTNLNNPKEAKANYKLALEKGALLSSEVSAFIASK